MQGTRFPRGRGVTCRERDFDRFVDERGLEELRQALRRELRTHAGQRTLARTAGVSRAVVRKFAEGRSVPTPESLARLREWAADRPPVETPLGAVALALLVAELPPGERTAARRRLAEALAAAYVAAGAEVPPWLVRETGG